MSLGTICPNSFTLDNKQAKIYALIIASSLFFLTLFSNSALATMSLSAGNSSAAPVNNLVLNFSWTNSTIIGGVNNTANITFKIPTGLVNLGSATTNVTGNLSTVSVSNASTVTFGNTTTNDTTNLAGWFAFNVSANSSGVYNIISQEIYNLNNSALNSSSNITSTIILSIVNGTITITNATFSNSTYTGTGTSFVMNFSANFSSPTGGGNINSNVTLTLYVNTSNTTTSSTVLAVTNSTNISGGGYATNVTLSNTQFTPNNYSYTLNTTGCISSGACNYSSTSFTTVLQISKGTLSLSIVGPNATYPTAVNIGPSKSNTGDADVNYTFFRNTTSTVLSSANGTNPSNDTTQLGAGFYIYTLNTTAGTTGAFTNWTANTTGVTYNVNVSIGTPAVIVQINGTGANNTQTYPTSVLNITGFTNSGGVLPIFYLYTNSTAGNAINLTSGVTNSTSTFQFAAGTWQMFYNTSGNANWTSAQNNTIYAIVNNGTAVLTLWLNNATSNLTVLYPAVVEFRANTTSTGANDLVFRLWTNGTNQVNGTNAATSIRFGVGTVNLTYNTTGGANYTSANNGTLGLTVNAGIQSITIYINGSTNGTYPIEKNVSSIVNITAVSNATIDNVTSSFNIYVNYTGVNLSASSTSGPVINNLYNTTNTSNLNVGNQTIIANISSTANYSSATNTTAFILWVQDNTPPSITSFTLTRATTIYVGSTLSSGDFACPSTDNDWQSTDTTTISGLSTTEPGTKTATCSVKDPSGNSASRTTSYTVYSLSSPSSATSTSASGSVAATTGTVKATALILQVAAGGVATVNIDKSLATGINQITIGVSNLASNVAVNVAKLTDKPSDVSAPPTGTTLNYINITVDNLPTYYVTNATIQFFVPKAWIQQNNIDANTISLNRYVNGQWNNLGSIKVSDDVDSVYYQSATPGFSLFSITGQQAAVTAPPTQTNQTANQTPTQPPAVTPSGNVNPLIIGVIIAIILLAAGYFYYQQNKKPWDDLKGKYK